MTSETWAKFQPEEQTSSSKPTLLLSQAPVFRTRTWRHDTRPGKGWYSLAICITNYRVPWLMFKPLLSRKSCTRPQTEAYLQTVLWRHCKIIAKWSIKEGIIALCIVMTLRASSSTIKYKSTYWTFVNTFGISWRSGTMTPTAINEKKPEKDQSPFV